MGNKNREGRRNPQLLVSGKTTHMEVLDLKLYPGKGSLTQKSGSSEVLCWSRHRKVHLLYRAVRGRFLERLQVLLPCTGNSRSGFAQEPRGEGSEI